MVHNITTARGPLDALIAKMKLAAMLGLAIVACFWLYSHKQEPVANSAGSTLHCGSDQFKATVPADPTKSRDLPSIYAVSPVVNKVTLGKVAKLNGLEPTSSVGGNALGEVCIFYTGKGVSASTASEGATQGN